MRFTSSVRERLMAALVIQTVFGALDPGEQTTLRSLLTKLADVHRISNVPVD